MKATRQPDASDAGCEFHAWPAGSVGRLVSEDGDVSRWIVRAPCGCLATIRATGVIEFEDGSVSFLGALACRHGETRLERGTWRGM